MRYLDYKARILAANKLLQEHTTSRQKFDAVRKLLQGTSTPIDNVLKDLSHAWEKLELIQRGDVIILSADHLPDDTHQQKKLKKAILLLLKYWRQLKSEVTNIKTELESQQTRGVQPASPQDAIGIVHHFARAKGPLGLVTFTAAIIAIAAVYLQSQAVTIHLISQDCPDIPIENPLPFPLPGLRLPNSLPSNATTQATIPPLKIHANLALISSSSVTFLGYRLSFQVPRYITNITINNLSLINTPQTVDFSTQPEHTVQLTCH
jgi:hypothetical protein